MNKLVCCCSFIIAICIGSNAANAEKKFISDKIFVSVYEQPHEQGQVVFTILTGSSVEVLASKDDYVQVKNREGITGWLQNKYISNEKPAELAFLQIQKKYELATTELKSLKRRHTQTREFDKTAKALIETKSELGQLQKEHNSIMNNLVEKSDALEKANATIVMLTDEIKQKNEPEINQEQQVFSLSIGWTLAALLLSLVGGFTLGVRWLEKKISKKYSGLRLY